MMSLLGKHSRQCDDDDEVDADLFSDHQRKRRAGCTYIAHDDYMYVPGEYRSSQSPFPLAFPVSQVLD